MYGKEKLLFDINKGRLITQEEMDNHAKILRERIANVKTGEDFNKLDEDYGPIPENIRKMLETRVKANKSSINEWD